MASCRWVNACCYEMGDLHGPLEMFCLGYSFNWSRGGTTDSFLKVACAPHLNHADMPTKQPENNESQVEWRNNMCQKSPTFMFWDFILRYIWKFDFDLCIKFNLDLLDHLVPLMQLAGSYIIAADYMYYMHGFCFNSTTVIITIIFNINQYIPNPNHIQPHQYHACTQVFQS